MSKISIYSSIKLQNSPLFLQNLASYHQKIKFLIAGKTILNPHNLKSE